MKSLYDLEDEDMPKRGPTGNVERPHDFRFNRETRRMVCERCGGLMNECPPICPGMRVMF